MKQEFELVVDRKDNDNILAYSRKHGQVFFVAAIHIDCFDDEIGNELRYHGETKVTMELKP